MKALVITGSRADRNSMETVHEALLKAGHDSTLAQPNEWASSARELTLGVIANAKHGNVGYMPDVAIVGGDRHEILEAAVLLAHYRVPIAHIGGGDVTEGSADDRYRDAITALSCIHFAENEPAYLRLTQHLAKHPDDRVYHTGCPALDRIKQTPVLDRAATFADFFDYVPKRSMLVCVHPNTVTDDPFLEHKPTVFALAEVLSADNELNAIVLGGNKDRGGDHGNEGWRIFARGPACAGRVVFTDTVAPQLYYSLLTHCDVMVGNSSAMLYEAPSFGLPCVLVGDRQKGRINPGNVFEAVADARKIAQVIENVLKCGRIETQNPYGDGHAAPRIVKALEENAWRWSKNKRAELAKSL